MKVVQHSGYKGNPNATVRYLSGIYRLYNEWQLVLDKEVLCILKDWEGIK